MKCFKISFVFLVEECQKQFSSIEYLKERNFNAEYAEWTQRKRRKVGEEKLSLEEESGSFL